MNNLDASLYKDELVIHGSTVVWSLNDGLVRKRTFDFENDKQPVTQALFTVFSSPSSNTSTSISTVSTLEKPVDLSPSQSSHDSPNKALVVVLKTLMHIIYLDGGSYIVHLPFPIIKVWAISLGLLLERQLEPSQTSGLSHSETQLPRLFTLFSPLDEFGVVSCNRSSLDPDEEIVFVSPRNDALWVTRNIPENRITLWHASPDHQARRKSKPPIRRRSSVGPATYSKSTDDDDDNDKAFSQSSLHVSESSQPMERHNSRLSDVSFTMDRTSFADPDRLTVLMGEPEGLKHELNLQIIESFPFDSKNAFPDVFVINASRKLDILCLHELPSQVLHLYHLSKRNSGLPAFKEKSRIPALSAIPITVHKSQRLLVLSSDLILRIQAPWYTRLNIVFPSTRSWRSISQANGNRFTLIDTKSHLGRYHLDLVPQNRLVAWCMDVLECVLDSNVYALFLSVYGIARLKDRSTDLSAFFITLFACFLAANNRSPSPSPHPGPTVKHDQDQWQTLHSILEHQSQSQPLNHSTLTSLVPQAGQFVHHFEGAQKSNYLIIIFLALHALSEELRLHAGMVEHNMTFVSALCQLAYWLGRTTFVEYYMSSNADIETTEFDIRSFSSVRDTTFAQQDPWSIYKWLISCVQAAVPRVQHDEMLTLDLLLFKAFPDKTPPSDRVNQARSLLLSIDKLRNVYPLLNLRDFRSAFINAMEDYKITTAWLENLPLGVAYPLKFALSVCKRQPLSTWSESTYELIDRRDLVDLLRMHTHKSDPSLTYNLGPRPIDVGTVTEICQDVQSLELSPSGVPQPDDHEIITTFIFRNDRRMLEVGKLLEYSLAGVTFWQRNAATVSEHAFANAQQVNVQGLAIRALAMPIGKGILNFSSRTPLPTEKFHVPGFSFVFRMKPQNAIVTVDKSFLTDTITQWPLFHLGVAGALSISPDSKDIDTSWIVFNKPNEPTSRHAGFLLGLGLNGHLKKIARWHLLNYLTTKHVLTSVALLLGLGVSYLGSKDPKITKLLSVHVAAMLPPGAADLKVNIWIQTAGIMALGLLYFDTRHHRTSEVLLSELTVSAKSVAFSYSSSIPPELQRDEGYRLACGLALGFINLGKGPELRSPDERAMIDRLCRIAEGLTVSENAEKNMVVAVPGCLSALALMYLRTNNEAMARKLEVPQTAPLMEYVRPDLLFLRTVAKNLVMWDSISPTMEWIHSQFPGQILNRKRSLPALDSEALDIVSIMTGACYVMGLRFAGTHNQVAKECLLHHLDRLMKVCSLKAMTYDENISRINLRAFLDALCLALAAVMAGSGDLDVLRRLRRLHGRRHDEANYGGHMASHMAIGILFMSGGQYTIGTSPLATAALFCATYPKFPSTPADNNFHLQALRHLWVLAADNRCLVPRSVDTYRPSLVVIKVFLRSDASKSGIQMLAPCLLPDLSTIASIETVSPGFQHVTLDFAARPDLFQQFKQNPMIFVVGNPIATAYRTPFEQGLARVVKADNGGGGQRRSVARAVQECLQTSYVEEELGTSEDATVQSISQIGTTENPLDTKCGLLHNISSRQTADVLFDVKLALTSFDVRKNNNSLDMTDEVLTDDFVERAHFRLWTSAKPPAEDSAGIS